MLATPESANATPVFSYDGHIPVVREHGSRVEGGAQRLGVGLGRAVGRAATYFRSNRLSRMELRTTKIELNAMAAAAIMGLSRPAAATGIAMTL